MAGGGMHPLHPPPLGSIPAGMGGHSLNCESHQKSLAYFSHLETFCFFTKKRQSKKRGPLHKFPPKCVPEIGHYAKRPAVKLGATFLKVIR